MTEPNGHAREDAEFLEPTALNTQQLRRVLSKYEVPVPTSAANKSFLVKLYKEHQIDQKIRQRWAEDDVRRTTKRPRTIELADQPQKVRKVLPESRSPHAKPKPEPSETLSTIVQNYITADEGVPMEIDSNEMPAPSVPVPVQVAPLQNTRVQNVQVSPFQMKASTPAPRSSTAAAVPLTAPSGKVTNTPSRVRESIPPAETPTKRLKPKRGSNTPSRQTASAGSVQPSAPLQAPSPVVYTPAEPIESKSRPRRRRTSSIRPIEREKVKREKQETEMERESSCVSQWASIILIFILLCMAGVAVVHFSYRHELPYCGSGEPVVPGVCVPCPANGFCEKMSYKCSCPPGYVVSHDRTMCIEDRSIPQMAERLLTDHVRPLLRRHKGEYLCGHAAVADLPEKEVEVHLRLEYSRIAPDDVSFSDFYQILSRMREMYPLHQIYRTTPNEFVHEAMVGTNEEPLMSIGCSLKLLFWQYWPLFVILPPVLLYGLWKFIIYQKKQDVLQQIRYTLRQSAEEDPEGRGVSVQYLRDLICPHHSKLSLNAHVWKAVEVAVAYDDRILDTDQLLNGTPTLMWEWRTDRS